jgi:ribosomal protein L14E/L6E/L27E
MKKSIAIAALIGTAILVHAEFKELQINGSFEALDNNNMPVKWVNNDVFKAEGKLGKVAVLTEGAQEGKNCVEIKTSPSELVHFFSGNMADVKPGDKIKISYYIKGTGNIRAGVYVYNAKTVWCGDLVQETESIDAKDWTLKEVTLEVPDKEYPGKGQTGKVRPLFQVDGDAALQIDNVKFSVETK